MVSFSVDVAGARDRLPEAVPAALGRLAHDQRERDQHDDAEVGGRYANAQRGAADATPRSGRQSDWFGCAALVGGGDTQAPPRCPRPIRSPGRRTPRAPSSQPPNLSISNSSAGSGTSRRQQLRQHGAVALLLVDALRVLGEEEVAERLRLVAPVGRDGDGVLDQDRLVGDDVLDVLAGLLGRDRLVLVASRTSPLPPTNVWSDSRADLSWTGVFSRICLMKSSASSSDLPCSSCGAVGGHQVPLRTARRERVRRDDLDIAGDEVVPESGCSCGFPCGPRTRRPSW